MENDIRCTEDVRQEVRCGGCGYEWKLNSFVEGLTAEMCIVCGSLVVQYKPSRTKLFRSSN
jgi:hypothetical protein